MKYHALDLYAGPGGWDIAARRLGIRPMGYEWDADAVATRRANGLATRQMDLKTTMPVTIDMLDLVIASPPCPGFSKVGKGKGRDDIIDLPAALEQVWETRHLLELMDELERTATDPRTIHVLIPLLWVMTTLPGAVAWEQVPPVLPVWEACAVVLRRLGYEVVTGIVHSEQHGVGQTRERAALLGKAGHRADGMLTLPPPTHSRYHSRTPDRLDPDVEKWLSMSDVCGWDEDDIVGFMRRADGRDPGLKIDGVDYRLRDLRRADLPAFALTSKVRSWKRFSDWDRRVNNQSGTEFDLAWQANQPATTVAGRSLVGFRGANANRFNGSTKSRNDGLNVTVAEAAALQGFPNLYRFEGSVTSQYQQVGNAVPVPLADALLKQVVS